MSSDGNLALSDTARLTGGEESECCFHCGTALATGSQRIAYLSGGAKHVCSARCADIVQAIESTGFDRFYRQRRGRSTPPAKLDQSLLTHLDAYDNLRIQRQFLEQSRDALARTTLLLEGIHCAACVRLIESRLITMPGIQSITLNATIHRAEVTWDPKVIKLSAILREIYNLGYAAYPFDADKRQSVLARERKSMLQRLALAALFSMQIMMFTLALYAGEWFSMSDSVRIFLRGVNAVLCVPLLIYCAAPFYRGAYRDLRNHQLGMDVPVALALSLAFFASVYTLSSGAGEVYFESIAMFVTLLLASRYFELGTRIKASRCFDDLARVLPKLATRINTTGSVETLSPGELRVGDRALVKAGETIPVDGVIVTGQSEVNEAVVSGESVPIYKHLDDSVLAGSINIESPLEIRVVQTVESSFVSEIARLAQNAQSSKPRFTVLADRIARRFVAGVLIAASLVVAYWWMVDPAQIIATTIAVLIISCPCALALATPAAMTAASGALMRRGIAAVNPNVIETLARTTTFVFDKTGTLTTGELEISAVHCAAGYLRDDALAVAKALSAHSEHSIGRSLQRLAIAPAGKATESVNFPGQGISGIVNAKRYWLGSRQFVSRTLDAELPATESTKDKTVVLADGAGLIATFHFRDETKAGAAALATDIAMQGPKLAMISGDNLQVAESIAAELDIGDVCAAMLPHEKLAELKRRQRDGEICAVVGDGVNDAPMLAQGDISIAVGNACDLSKLQADLVMLNADLPGVGHAYRISRKTMRVIRQNIGWAIAYNACALPLAIAGVVPPWLAALGMSLSSLLVVANAARIDR